jgi:hypothetical protein
MIGHVPVAIRWTSPLRGPASTRSSCRLQGQCTKPQELAILLAPEKFLKLLEFGLGKVQVFLGTLRIVTLHRGLRSA